MKRRRTRTRHSKGDSKGILFLICGIILAVVVAAVIIIVICLQKKEEKKPTPQDAVMGFVAEYNQENINGMLEYIEPSEAELIRSGMQKLDELANSESMKQLVKWMPFLATVAKDVIFQKIEPEIVRVKEDENNAVVTISLENAGKLSYYDVHMIKIEEKWYIQYAWKSSKATNENNLQEEVRGENNAYYQSSYDCRTCRSLLCTDSGNGGQTPYFAVSGI